MVAVITEIFQSDNFFGMSIKEQFQNQLWATSSDYEEVLPYLNDPNYDVVNTYHVNGLFDCYYIGLR
jgi:hypothetical protein